MASPTKVHKRQKELKAARAGKARKNAVKNQGSTAKDLPLNKPNANEIAHKAKLKAKAAAKA